MFEGTSKMNVLLSRKIFWVFLPGLQRHRSLSKHIGVVIHKFSSVFNVFETISDDYMISHLASYRKVKVQLFQLLSKSYRQCPHSKQIYWNSGSSELVHIYNGQKDPRKNLSDFYGNIWSSSRTEKVSKNNQLKYFLKVNLF